ncbi:hypothetical protein PVK37_11775 [Micromonospora cathayae]|uniref:Phage late control gene D protein (GPD) n=1 Tax=Micromonospora cathayae TaxID=3028804 RepID=A0ABY7ZVD4_9ACTN|nr:hypothetical protein [Micromonospora sp. HUAS 3]WDZ87022.1 hypothetical protein PVK37_11775 [Micromonospora sp. HUAS 3]
MSGAAGVDRQHLLWGTAVLRPRVTTGTAGRDLPDPVAAHLVRVVVDTQLALPDMFELTFVDVDGDLLTRAGLQLGTAVQVFGPSQDGTAEHRLISGEVTALEGRFVDLAAYVVVRGYTHDHRLHRVRRTRTFLNQSDADIARQVASAAKLTVGTVDATGGKHAHLSQVDQTDWEFLAGRAREIGYELGADGDRFHFRRAATARAGGNALPLTFRGNLRRFLPRVTAGNLAPEVEVRTWDPVAATVVASRTETTADGVSLGAGRTPVAAADPFVPRAAPAPPRPGDSAVGDVGPAPGPRAHVLVGRGLPVPNRADDAVRQVAASLAASVGGSFAEAEGETLGDARLVAGRAVRVDGVPAPFAGTWTVSAARHVFDETTGPGYRTEFTVGGRQDRSLLGLAGTTDGTGGDPGRPGSTGWSAGWSATSRTRRNWAASSWPCPGCRPTTRPTGLRSGSCSPARPPARSSYPSRVTRCWSPSSSVTSAARTCWAACPAGTPGTAWTARPESRARRGSSRSGRPAR